MLTGFFITFKTSSNFADHESYSKILLFPLPLGMSSGSVQDLLGNSFRHRLPMQYERIHQQEIGYKVFNVGEEFMVHVFKAHFIARICSILGISSPGDSGAHRKL